MILLEDLPDGVLDRIDAFASATSEDVLSSSLVSRRMRTGAYRRACLTAKRLTSLSRFSCCPNRATSPVPFMFDKWSAMSVSPSYQYRDGSAASPSLDEAKAGLYCSTCLTLLFTTEDIESPFYHGAFGPAYLVRHVCDANVRVSRSECREVHFATGLYLVSTVYCANCKTAIGEHYYDAYDPSNSYKVGMTLVEQTLVTIPVCCLSKASNRSFVCPTRWCRGCREASLLGFYGSLGTMTGGFRPDLTERLLDILLRERALVTYLDLLACNNESLMNISGNESSPSGPLVVRMFRSLVGIVKRIRSRRSSSASASSPISISLSETAIPSEHVAQPSIPSIPSGMGEGKSELFACLGRRLAMYFVGRVISEKTAIGDSSPSTEFDVRNIIEWALEFFHPAYESVAIDAFCDELHYLCENAVTLAQSRRILELLADAVDCFAGESDRQSLARFLTSAKDRVEASLSRSTSEQDRRMDESNV